VCAHARTHTRVSCDSDCDDRSTGDRGTVQTRSWVVRYNFACARVALGAVPLPDLAQLLEIPTYSASPLFLICLHLTRSKQDFVRVHCLAPPHTGQAPAPARRPTATEANDNREHPLSTGGEVELVARLSSPLHREALSRLCSSPRDSGALVMTSPGKLRLGQSGPCSCTAAQSYAMATSTSES
jgi:hypothetical protein